MQDNDKNAEKFPFAYLPAPVASSFRDALGCYRSGLTQAYAAMCRATVQAVIADLGEGARLKIFDQVEEVAGLANIDDRVYRNIRSILFDTEAGSLHDAAEIDRETTAVLLEIIKDILHQAYVRRAVLIQKLKMRRFFATQDDAALEDPVDDPKVSPIHKKGAA
jgi:hypothetical protein